MHSFTASLEISGERLLSIRNVTVYVTPYLDGIKIPQVISMHKTNSLNLAEYFADTSIPDPSCKAEIPCMKIRVLVPEAGTNRELLMVFKVGDSFSFEAETNVKRKTLDFTRGNIGTIVVMEGAPKEDVNLVKQDLKSILERKLNGRGSIEVHPLTLKDLEEITNQYYRIEPGPRRISFIEQNNVYYIVKGSITIVQKPCTYLPFQLGSSLPCSGGS